MRLSVVIVRVASLAAFLLFCVGCATLFHRNASTRRVIGTYSLWSGMGPPMSDARFAEFSCAGIFVVTTVDVSFAPGKSKGCSDPRQQRVTGTLPYSELREIRVMNRPEVLIFKTGTNPPALRVTDWKNGEQYRRAVTDLQVAYRDWKRRHQSK